MTANEFLQFLHRVEKLKSVPRHCWTADGVRESVAAHSWRMTVMALLLRDVFPQVDMDKVMRMCVIHDMGEAITGDIPTFEKTESDNATEQQQVHGLFATLPQPLDSELTALFDELEAEQTPEAKVYKAIDRMEAVLQHNEASLDTWLPLEYDLNRTYGWEHLEEFPFLMEVRKQLLQDTEDKIKGEN